MRVDANGLSGVVAAQTGSKGKVAEDSGPGSFAAVLQAQTSQSARRWEGLPSEQEKKENFDAAMRGARANDADAEKSLQAQCFGLVGPLIDVTDYPVVRYSVSGELKTPESDAYFAGVSKYATEQRLKILQEGRSSGASNADILKNIMVFNQSLPERYREMSSILY